MRTEIDLVRSMDWLEKKHTNVNYKKKKIVFWRPNQRPCSYIGYRGGGAVKLVLVLKASRLLESGGEACLMVVINAKQGLPKLQEIIVVRDFDDAFPE